MNIIQPSRIIYDYISDSAIFMMCVCEHKHNTEERNSMSSTINHIQNKSMCL